MSAQIYIFTFIWIRIYMHAYIYACMCAYTHSQRLFDITILLLALTKKIRGIRKMASLTESNFESNHPSL